MKFLKTSLFLSALTASLIFSGCSFGKETSEDISSENGNVPNPSEEISAEDRENYNMAISQRDPSFCEKIQNSVQAENCINDIRFQEAGIQNDSSECDKITEENQKQSCKDNLLFNEAGMKRDEKICDGISTPAQKEMCRNNVRGMETMKLPPAE